MNNKKGGLYETLGVGKSATQEELRAAYRKLAKENHPDLHPGDTAAEDKFKAVSAAYDILGDEAKRKKYDAGEIDATGAETFPGGFYRQQADRDHSGQYYASSGFEDISDLSDVFADLFGQRPQTHAGSRRDPRYAMRGGDVQYTLDVAFLDAVNGAKKRITLPTGQSLDVTIPKGINDQQTLRLKGKGHPGLGEGPPGDALITVTVNPHRVFKRQGPDIHIELPITLAEAIVGGTVDVPTVAGTVKMTVPKGSSSGKVLRLKGKGVKSKSSAGDQLVKLMIVLPEDSNDDLIRFMEDWSQSHAYDPRKSMMEAA